MDAPNTAPYCNPGPISLAGSRTADVEAEAHAGHAHILVVDDDPVIRDLVSEYLAKSDLRVTTAADAAAMRALLGKLGESSTNPRYVVTVRGAGYRIGVRVETVY